MTAILLVILAGSPPPPPASAIDRATDELMAQLTKANPEPPVGVFLQGAASPLARGFSTVLTAKLAKAKRAPVDVQARDEAEAERHARESGVRSLVRLTVSVEETKLVARGDALGTWVNFWSGATPTRSGPGVILVSSVDADAEALTLGGVAAISTPTTTLDLKLQPLAKLPGLASALAVGDLDGDGRAEIVVLVREELWVFNADGKPLGRYDLSTTQLAATPTRDAFGALSISGSKLTAWSGRRAHAEVLAWSAGAFKNVGTADSLSLDGMSAKLDVGNARFSAEVSIASKSFTLPAPFQAGSTRDGVSLVVMPDSSASVVRGVVPTTKFTGVGCGSTLADLDGDGQPEVVLSSSRTTGDADELRVISVAAAESLQARSATFGEASVLWQLALTKGRAIIAAAGDLDASPGEEAVLATWAQDGTGELLVLRRAAP